MSDSKPNLTTPNEKDGDSPSDPTGGHIRDVSPAWNGSPSGSLCSKDSSTSMPADPPTLTPLLIADTSIGSPKNKISTSARTPSISSRQSEKSSTKTSSKMSMRSLSWEEKSHNRSASSASSKLSNEQPGAVKPSPGVTMLKQSHSPGCARQRSGTSSAKSSRSSSPAASPDHMDTILSEVVITTTTLDHHEEKRPEQPQRQQEAPRQLYKARTSATLKPPTAAPHAGTSGNTGLRRIPRPSTPVKLMPASTRRSTNSSPVQQRTLAKVQSPTKKPINRVTGSNIATNKTVLEVQYDTIWKRLQTMKKDVNEKQKKMLDTYSTMLSMKSKIAKLTGREVDLESMRLVTCGREELADIIKSSKLVVPEAQPDAEAKGEATSENIPVLEAETLLPMSEGDFLNNMEGNLKRIPITYTTVCKKALDKNQAFIEWFKKVQEDGKQIRADGDVMEQFAIQEKESETLSELLVMAEKNQKCLVSTIISSWRSIWSEYQDLSKENADVHQKLEELTEDLAKAKHEITEFKNKYLEVSTSLEQEIAKNKKGQTEALLKSARAKLKEAETKMSNQECKINQLNTTIKNMETSQKQKDNNLEQRLREVSKKCSTHEAEKAVQDKLRIALENRVRELTESIQMEKKSSAKNIEDSNKFKELLDKYTEQTRLRENAEEGLVKAEEHIRNLEEKSHNLALAVEQAQVLSEGAASEPAQLETWTELEAMRLTVKSLTEENNGLKEEKLRFVRMLSEQGQMVSRADYSKEVIFRDEQINNLKRRIAELEMESEENNANASKYLKKISHLESRLSRADTGSEVQQHNAELQDEIMNLQVALDEWKIRNEELTKELKRKSIDLECKERSMREQSNVLKVRDELIMLLKERECETKKSIQRMREDYDEKVEMVQKEITAKADELHTLFSTLEMKQVQVARLEKIVKSLEEQQTRGQAQRTRYEEKIAMMESELAEYKTKNGPRYVENRPQHRRFPFL